MIIHGGYQRCATTFLQEEIFINLKDYLCLSKPQQSFSAGKRKFYFEEKKELSLDESIKKLYHLQNEAFPRKYPMEPMMPRNTSFQVEKYKKELMRIITSNEDKNFILSDETLFDKMNYHGDENILHFAEIIRSLKKKIDIDVKFIITIRNQADLLTSIFAYDYYRQKKNFKNFQNFIINFLDEEKEYKQIFRFDFFYEKVRNLFDCEILVLPLEQLTMEKNNYITRLKNFIETDMPEKINYEDNFKKLKFTEKNTNFYHIKGVRFQHFYDFLASIHRLLSNISIYKSIYKHLGPVKKYLRSFMKGKVSGKITVEKKNDQLIKSAYFKYNKNLEKLTKLKLDNYNYY